MTLASVPGELAIARSAPAEMAPRRPDAWRSLQIAAKAHLAGKLP